MNSMHSVTYLADRLMIMEFGDQRQRRSGCRPASWTKEALSAPPNLAGSDLGGPLACRRPATATMGDHAENWAAPAWSGRADRRSDPRYPKQKALTASSMAFDRTARHRRSGRPPTRSARLVQRGVLQRRRSPTDARLAGTAEGWRGRRRRRIEARLLPSG